MLAYFLGINLAASAVSALVWELVEKRAESWRARTRANTAFALRTLPPLIAVTTITFFILPAYILFEPAKSGETVSIKLAAVVAFSILGSLIALYRVVVGQVRTHRLRQRWIDRSEPVLIARSGLNVRALRNPLPIVAVLGIFRPRVFVASCLLDELDDRELAAAIAHEAGHVAAGDNLKRFLMRVCADLLLFRFGRRIDHAWVESAEIAADEYVAHTRGQHGALDLASALIKIGRLTPGGIPLAVGGSQISGGHAPSLAARVERLLKLAESPEACSAERLPGPAKKIALVLALMSAALLPFVLGIEFLAIVHSATESLMHILS